MARSRRSDFAKRRPSPERSDRKSIPTHQRASRAITMSAAPEAHASGVKGEDHSDGPYAFHDAATVLCHAVRHG
jgi:hypothetical protein